MRNLQRIYKFITQHVTSVNMLFFPWYFAYMLKNHIASQNVCFTVSGISQNIRLFDQKYQVLFDWRRWQCWRGKAGIVFQEKTRPGNIAQQHGLISLMKCYGRAWGYYPSGCYCTKPKTGNEMMYGLLQSRPGVCTCMSVSASVCVKWETGRRHLPDGGNKRWSDCVREKIYLCLACVHPCSSSNMHRHMHEHTIAFPDLTPFSSRRAAIYKGTQFVRSWLWRLIACFSFCF